MLSTGNVLNVGHFPQLFDISIGYFPGELIQVEEFEVLFNDFVAWFLISIL